MRPAPRSVSRKLTTRSAIWRLHAFGAEGGHFVGLVVVNDAGDFVSINSGEWHSDPGERMVDHDWFAVRRLLCDNDVGHLGETR